MSTTISGVVSNGVVVLSTPLAEGTRVSVEVEEKIDATGPLSPSELIKLPREQRAVILAKGAELAEEEYRTNKDLTDFNAFSEELDDDSD
jgi:hypothetical protein